MQVSLDPTLQNCVNEKVRSGQFESANDLLNAAVALMKDQEEWTPEDVANLRQDLAEAIAQSERGEVAQLDMEEIKARVRDASLRQPKAG